MYDLIERQAAIDALWKIKDERDSVYYTSAIYAAGDAIMELPSAQPDLQQTCNKLATDCISRQAAIDEIKALYKWHDIVTEDRAIDHFKRLPSAQPEIIRCNDCKWLGEQGLCGKWDQYISNGDFYCGCAERRTDG